MTAAASSARAARPGTTGTPPASIRRPGATFFPIARMLGAGGPRKGIPRRAIPPRFATRTLVTLANRHQHFVGADDGSLFREDFTHRPADGRHDVVLHLHRLQHDDHVTQPDAVPGLDLDLDHHTLHRRLNGPVATG